MSHAISIFPQYDLSDLFSELSTSFDIGTLTPEPSSGMSAHLQRAQYPFQRKTLERLLGTISDLRSNLSLATSTLQLDVSITSLDQLTQVDTYIKSLIDNSQASSTKIIDSVSKIYLNQEQEKLRALASEERDVIKWLSPLDFSSKQNDSLSRRQEGTGQWLLETVEFRSWLDAAGRVLWCPGIREYCFQ